MGVSYQLAIGPHAGGVLVELPTGGAPIGWPANQWNRTNGSAPHLCLPIAGRRISLIAYTHVCSLYSGAAAQRATARKLGFPLPSESVAASVLEHYQAQNAEDTGLGGGLRALESLCDSLATCAGSYGIEAVASAHYAEPGAFVYAMTPAQERVPRAIIELLVLSAHVWNLDPPPGASETVSAGSI